MMYPIVGAARNCPRHYWHCPYYFEVTVSQPPTTSSKLLVPAIQMHSSLCAINSYLSSPGPLASMPSENSGSNVIESSVSASGIESKHGQVANLPLSIPALSCSRGYRVESRSPPKNVYNYALPTDWIDYPPGRDR